MILREYPRPLTAKDLDRMEAGTEADVLLCSPLVKMHHFVSYNNGEIGASKSLDGTGTIHGLEIESHHIDKFESDKTPGIYRFHITKMKSGGFNMWRAENWGRMSSPGPTTQILLQTTDLNDKIQKFIGEPATPVTTSGASTTGPLITTTDVLTAAADTKYHWTYGTAVSTSNCMFMYQSTYSQNALVFRVIQQGFQLKTDTIPKNVVLSGNSTNGYTISNGSNYANIRNNSCSSKSDIGTKTPWFLYHRNNITPSCGSDGQTCVWDDSMQELEIRAFEGKAETFPLYSDQLLQIGVKDSYLTAGQAYTELYYGKLSESSCWLMFSLNRTIR